MEKTVLAVLCSGIGTLTLITIRYILELYIYTPLGVELGLESVELKGQTLMGMFKIKQLISNVRSIVIFQRLPKNTSKTPQLAKFNESAWRCTYYSLIWTYGMVMLMKKPWLWNINECWTNFEEQEMDFDVFVFGETQTSFYASLCVTQFVDVRRKDFWEMLIHHVVCLTISGFSWFFNLSRVVTLIVVVYDINDIFLEAGKLANYVKYNKLSTIILFIFTVVWIITRLVIFPLWIFKNCLADPSGVLTKYYYYYPFNALLLTLFGLNWFWSYLIFKLVYKSFQKGQLEKDIRSDTEDE